jgi:hypothetical protein
MSVQTTPSGATVESVPFPDPLTPAQAKPGTIVHLFLDDGGKLFRIDGPATQAGQVKLTREDGRKSRARIGDLQLTDRPFPTLPDYIPAPGDFVVTDRVRGWNLNDALMVTKLTGGKATVMRLDGSGRYSNVPFAALRPAEVKVEVIG